MNPLVAQLERFFRDVRGVTSVYLFGSHAENRTHRESDVDVGVLLDRGLYPTSRERFDVRVDLSSAVPPLVGITADVVILNDVPPPLARRILTSGRRVYCSDEEADHVFVRTTLSRAADLGPFLRRTRATKIDSFAR